MAGRLNRGEIQVYKRVGIVRVRWSLRAPERASVTGEDYSVWSILLAMPGTSIATVHLEESLLRRIDAVAKDLDVSRDRLLEKAAEDYLRRQENQKLLDQIDRAASRAEETPAEKELRLRLREQHRRLVEGDW